MHLRSFTEQAHTSGCTPKASLPFPSVPRGSYHRYKQACRAEGQGAHAQTFENFLKSTQLQIIQVRTDKATDLQLDEMTVFVEKSCMAHNYCCCSGR